MASLSYRRQPSLVRLRPVLRLAGLELDDSHVFPLRPVRVAKPCAQGKLDVPVGSPAADWCTVCTGRHFTVAARVLSDLSRDCRRPWRERLLATLALAAVLAVRTAVVLGSALGVEHSRGCDAPLHSRMGRASCRTGGLRRRKSDSVLCRSGDGIRACLCPLGAGLFTVHMGEYRPNLVSAQPTVALPRLFPCRLRGRGPWHRSRPARQRWCAGATLGGVARRSLGRGFSLGRADLHDDGGLEQRSSGRETCRQPGFCRRLRGWLLLLAGDLPALHTRAHASV